VDAVLDWIEEREKWLLIYDNGDEPEILPHYLPKRGKGHVLITSRADDLQGVGRKVSVINLNAMKPADALSFLLRRTSREKANEEEMETANQ